MAQLICMIIGYWICKALGIFDDERKTARRKGPTFHGMWDRFFSEEEAERYGLEALRTECPHIFEEVPDVCEYLNIKPERYTHKGQLFCNGEFFTVSAKDRFICKGLLDSSEETLRELPLVDFSEKRFSPIANPFERSISVGDYKFYFERPYFYNLMLMLLIDADKKFSRGERIWQRAVKYPQIKIEATTLARYGITFDPDAREALALENASFAQLNDFNSEDWLLRAEGNIALRVVDKPVAPFDHFTPCAVRELLENESAMINVAPGKAIENGEIYLPPHFLFLHYADDVTIRGNEDNFEIFVCRLRAGWGGIRFRVQNRKDYYRLAAWLVPAVAYAAQGTKGWDKDEIIKRYWPSYREKAAE